MSERAYVFSCLALGMGLCATVFPAVMLRWIDPLWLVISPFIGMLCIALVQFVMELRASRRELSGDKRYDGQPAGSL